MPLFHFDWIHGLKTFNPERNQIDGIKLNGGFASGYYNNSILIGLIAGWFNAGWINLLNSIQFLELEWKQINQQQPAMKPANQPLN